ncbi:MAG: hypothetical protein V4858_17160 [Pseudomonadota bacterium]
MTLTTKQETFAQAVADGMSQADAYRSAYDASKSKPETIWSKASELMADGKVAARVDELRAVLASKALWTREKSVSRLADIADDAEARAAEKVSAIKELNAMHGFNAPTKLEVSGSLIAKIERVIVRPTD